LRVDVASWIGSHSRTREVCVAPLRRRFGGEGDWRPYVLRIRAWRSANAACDFFSASEFSETVMSTMEPEVMEAGSRIEGNSI
jgi:hypothetical protein